MDLPPQGVASDGRSKLKLIVLDEGNRKMKTYSETIGRQVADWIRKAGTRRVNVVCVHPEVDTVKLVLSAISAHLRSAESTDESGIGKRSRGKDAESWQTMTMQGFYQYMGKFSEVMCPPNAQSHLRMLSGRPTDLVL